MHWLNKILAIRESGHFYSMEVNYYPPLPKLTPNYAPTCEHATPRAQKAPSAQVTTTPLTRLIIISSEKPTTRDCVSVVVVQGAESVYIG